MKYVATMYVCESQKVSLCLAITRLQMQWLAEESRPVLPLHSIVKGILFARARNPPEFRVIDQHSG